jgi:hypothetical protein
MGIAAGYDREMIAELTSVSYSREDPVEELLDTFFCYIDYFFKHPNVFRFFYFYPFVQPEGDVSWQKLEERLSGMWQTSFFRLTQEGIMDPGDIEVAAKTIIYALQGMIMLSFSSNGAMGQKKSRRSLCSL